MKHTVCFKRTLLALLCVLALFCLSGCSAAQPKKDAIVGTWECNDFNEAAGVMFGLGSELSGIGMIKTLGNAVDFDVDITFRENGTYQIDVAVNMFFVGSTTESMMGTYTWTDGQLSIDGSPVDAVIKGKKLTLTEDTGEGYVVRLEFTKVD